MLCLGGGRRGEFELFLEAQDLGMIDAFGVVVVFLFGTRLVDFLDVLVEGSGFCIPKTVATFFLFTVPDLVDTFWKKPLYLTDRFFLLTTPS